MYIDVLDHLQCPACGSKLNIDTSVKTEESVARTDLIEGILQCTSEDSQYPVIDGVAIVVDNVTEYLADRGNVLPDIVAATRSDQMRAFLAEAFADAETLEKNHYERAEVWPVYAWAHYDDVGMTDTLLSEAFENDEIVKELSPRTLTRTVESFLEDCDGEIGIDIGCATGGNTHTVATAVDFAVGCDISYTMVRTAREIRDSDGRFEYDVPMEGNLTERRTVSIDVPAPDQTEFIVADAEAVPFRDGTADIVVSMNLIDEISDPRAHLERADDILSPGGRFVICDPYIWGGVSGPKRWIGGTETSDGIERSDDALRAVLTDELGHKLIGSDESVPWTLKHSPRRYDLWMIDCVATEASLEE